jgi:hypothetical protein
MNSNELLQWYYLMYLVPGGAAMLVLLISAFGGVRHHRTGAHGGHHAGAHGAHGAHHSGAHGARGVHHAGGHGPQGNAHTQAHGSHGSHLRVSGQPRHGAARAQQGRAGAGVRQPFLEQLSLFFGVGRVPLPFLLGGALMGWGLCGVWATEYWNHGPRGTEAFWLPPLVMAIAGAVAAEKLTATLGTRMLPQTESYAVSNVDLCGLTGSVVYPVGAERGRIHVYDEHGTLHETRARLAPGQPTIDRGRTVLVVDYDAAADQVIVEPAP